MKPVRAHSVTAIEKVLLRLPDGRLKLWNPIGRCNYVMATGVAVAAFLDPDQPVEQVGKVESLKLAIETGEVELFDSYSLRPSDKKIYIAFVELPSFIVAVPYSDLNQWKRSHAPLVPIEDMDLVLEHSMWHGLITTETLPHIDMSVLLTPDGQPFMKFWRKLIAGGIDR